MRSACLAVQAARDEVQRPSAKREQESWNDVHGILCSLAWTVSKDSRRADIVGIGLNTYAFTRSSDWFGRLRAVSASSIASAASTPKCRAIQRSTAITCDRPIAGRTNRLANDQSVTIELKRRTTEGAWRVALCPTQLKSPKASPIDSARITKLMPAFFIAYRFSVCASSRAISVAANEGFSSATARLTHSRRPSQPHRPPASVFSPISITITASIPAIRFSANVVWTSPNHLASVGTSTPAGLPRDRSRRLTPMPANAISSHGQDTPPYTTHIAVMAQPVTNDKDHRTVSITPLNSTTERLPEINPNCRSNLRPLASSKDCSTAITNATELPRPTATHTPDRI